MAGGISIQASDGKYINLGFETGASGNVSTTLPKEGGKLATQSGLDTVMSTINASVPAAYHIYNGQLALANTVITNGFSTTLYTGNGTSQSITTGVDMDTQWGNDVSEKFGGLLWIKGRSVAYNNFLTDSINVDKYLISNSTAIQATADVLDFTSSGVLLKTGGTSSLTNENLATYASWNFQTTHRVSGTTNHGKAFTCHYNPFTGFTMVKYEGSGLAGHEIPHFLGRKLEFEMIKCLGTTANWEAHTQGKYLIPNLTDAGVTYTYTVTDSVSIQGINSSTNVSNQQHIMYGWSNSYFDEKNTLIGNYEIGVYQGTGVAGNKVTTRGKPAWVMIKRLDTTANWLLQDSMRGDKDLYANLSNAETSVDLTDFVQDGFVLKSTIGDCNASGGQYLYMVVYDNDSGSGKSKYPRATDTSTLNLSAHVPFANGIDTTGNKVSIAYKNETITLSSSLTQGKNYIALLNNGTYVASPSSPNYGSYNGFGDYFDLNSQKWFSSINVLTDDGSTITGWVADEASNGTVATISSTNGEFKIVNNAANNGAMSKSFTTVIGKRYNLVVTATSLSTGAFFYRLGSTQRGNDISAVAYTGTGKYVISFIANSTTTWLMLAIGGTTATGSIATFDNIAIYPVNADGSVDTSSASALTPRNYLDCVVYADQNGQPEYVEQIEKVQYFDAVKANDFRGKNACTAWVNFDGTTTPPTIRDSYNVSGVVRRVTGEFDIYFSTKMDNLNYVIAGLGTLSATSGSVVAGSATGTTLNIDKCSISTVQQAGTANILANQIATVLIFGGKN